MPDGHPLFQLIEDTLKEREAHGDRFSMIREFQGQAPTFVPWREVPVSQSVVAILSKEFSNGLYRHQAEAIAKVQQKRNVVVATRTSSGKSLIYTIPIAEAMIDSDQATALLLFPTKALTNDQLSTLAKRIPAILGAAGKPCSPNAVARYDGATPQEDRAAIRQDVRVLLTNADMVHLTVLAWHESLWHRFISNLRYVVLDEAHEYRGTFGSNISMLLQRLRLLCQRYGSNPRFISTSATIADPGMHLRVLTGSDFAVIDSDADGSEQGPKRFWIVRPSGHAFATARSLVEKLVEAERSVIAFCLSRWATEENREHFPDAHDPKRRIRVYRAGLSPQQRQDIERGLRDGSVRGVFATNALELGIDIGLLDVCICIGFPNTMMSLWQRAGRVGRGGKAGAVILIPEARPLDAFYTEHPDQLLERPNEPLAINLHSRTLGKWHYACALKEAKDDIERVKPEGLQDPMRTIASEHQAGRIDDAIFHCQNPHHEYSMRAGADWEYALIEADTRHEIGQISKSQIQLETPPSAIYRHDGERYRVMGVREMPNEVRVRKEYSHNRTQAFVNRKVQVLHCCGAKRNTAMQLEKCDHLRVVETLVNLTEKSPNGTTVRTWQGSQGLTPYVLPTTGVVLTVFAPLRLVRGADDRRPAETVAKEAWNGLGPLLTGMLPSVLGPCDIGDFAIASEWHEQNARLYFYDRAYDGIDLTLPAFDRLEELLSEAMIRIEECACQEQCGCFRCVRPQFEDVVTNRSASRHMLGSMLDSLKAGPLNVTLDEQRSTVSALEEIARITCPQCGRENKTDAKFCDNCGYRLAEP